MHTNSFKGKVSSRGRVVHEGIGAASSAGSRPTASICVHVSRVQRKRKALQLGRKKSNPHGGKSTVLKADSGLSLAAEELRAAVARTTESPFRYA